MSGIFRLAGSGFGSGGSDDINLQLDLATVSDYYSGRARLYQLPADEIPDTAIEDFSRARAALNAAFRLRDKVRMYATWLTAILAVRSM